MQTPTMNAASASGSYADSLTNDNFPGYFFDYTASFMNGDGEVSTSFIGLLPSNNTNERILSVECSGTLGYVAVTDGRIKSWHVTFDIFNITIFPQFILQYGLEGTLTLPTIQSSVLNASSYIDYCFDEDNRKIAFLINLSNVANVPPTGDIPFSFHVTIQDDLTDTYYVSSAYALQNFPQQYTGAGQTILVTTYLESGYLLSDIVKYLSNQGIQKTEAQIASQIDYVNVTPFTNFFWDGNFYRIPASDGYLCDPPISQLATAYADELTRSLEFIFTMAREANVLIAYYGCNCDPNTGALTSRVDAEMRLVSWMQANTHRFTIVSDGYDHLSPNSYSSAQQVTFDQTLRTLYNEYRPLVTSSGNLGLPEEDFFSISPYALSVGGSRIFMNATGDFEEVAYPFSSGGFYDTYDDALTPTYQIGVVEFPEMTPGNLKTLKQIGVPAVAGIAKNLYYVLNNVLMQTEGSGCVPPVMSSLFAVINQATGTRWSYIDILYREYLYVCNYISQGQSQEYDAADYANWNPITGLGWVDGRRLLSLLNPRFVYSGDKLCISSLSLQDRMSFLDFFPPTGLYEEAIRQPVFGVQSYWSYLVIYRVIPGTNSLDLNQDKIQDGDTVIIFSAIPSLHWVMTWDATGFVRLTRYENVITDAMKWVITMASDTNAFYEPIQFTIFTDNTVYLSSMSGLARPSSSPSLRDGYDSSTCDFIFRRHWWFLEQPNLYETVLEKNYCFYTNFANNNYYLTSSFNITNYWQGRQIVASFDTLAVYSSFPQYPEILMIPLGGYNISVVPETNQPYAIFNTLVQAFLRVVYIERGGDQRPVVQVSYYNAHDLTCDPRSFVYDECVFKIQKVIQTGVLPLFSPTISIQGTDTTSSLARYNAFYTKINLFNVSTYFTRPVITVGLSNNSSGPVNALPGVIPSYQINLFQNDPNKMLASLQNSQVWIRQILDPFSRFQNLAIYPGGGGGTVNLPYMGPYVARYVERGITDGRWWIQNSPDTDSRLNNEDGIPTYWYVSFNKKFIIINNEVSSNSRIADVENSRTWQPQMFDTLTDDPVDNWYLVPQNGPLMNYLFTGCNYDFVNAKSGRYISTKLNLQHTPAMYRDPNPTPSTVKPTQFLCLYVAANDKDT